MPRTPIDYSKCVIYKIEHIEDDSLLYVGLTTNFNKRKGTHKSICRNERSKEHNHKLYRMIRDNGGWEMFRMIEIEKYPCNDKREAEKRETEIMKELKASMNMVKSYATKEETKERFRIYRETHKEEIKERGKVYHETHKEEIKRKHKMYRETHKEEIKEKRKIRYEKSKELKKN